MSGDELVLGLVLGAGLGLVFAVLGAGGGVLAVPVLVHVFDRPMQQATGTSLAIAFGAALVAALAHGRQGNVEPKIAVVAGATALIGAPLGALLHRWVPEVVTIALYSLVLLTAAALVGFGRSGATERGRFATLPTLGLGLAIGVLSGLLGVGGGFLVVPALTAFFGVPVRRAIGTSAAVVCASSLSGAVTYAAKGAVEPRLLLLVGTSALAGAIGGARLSAKLPEAALRKAFAALALLACVRMLVSLGAR